MWRKNIHTCDFCGWCGLGEDLDDVGKMNGSWELVNNICPPEDEFIVVGLFVKNNKTNETNFEQYTLMREFDTGEVKTQCDEYFDAWLWSDFTHWQQRPQSPEE